MISKQRIISDAHNWIQNSRKSKIGATVLHCTYCNVDQPSCSIIDSIPCIPKYEYKSSGFTDCTSKYYYMHIAYGTYGHYMDG